MVAEDLELELEQRNGAYFANCARPGEEDHWLDWRDGALFTKTPEDWFVRKMQQLAKRLRLDDGREQTAFMIAGMFDLLEAEEEERST